MGAQGDDRPPGFEAANNDSLGSAGLSGPRYRATFDGGVLTFEGSDSGRIEIAAADVTRLRVAKAFGDPKLPSFLTVRLWRRGAAAPLVFAVQHDETSGYAATMKALAGAVAADGGLPRIETGRQPYYAYVVAPLCFLFIGYWAVKFGRIAWASGSGWDWMMTGLLGLMAVFGAQAVYNIRPHAVRTLDELDDDLRLP